jgi:hypothetical protein
MLTFFIIFLGLTLFEVVGSLDNAVINAEVLRTVRPRARHWFLTWGFFWAVIVVRGILPLFIVWVTVPEIGLRGALTAAFSTDPLVVTAFADQAPRLLLAAGIFLLFLFLRWIFLEPKAYGLVLERHIRWQIRDFHGLIVLLTIGIGAAALVRDTTLIWSVLIGGAFFFLVHGVKQWAEWQELRGAQARRSDVGKIAYLELIDTVFSIDGVVGAFAFTFSVPLILLGNGLGALVVRQLTVANLDAIRKYRYLKNGAMYSVLCLGTVMVLEGFGHHVPQYISPLLTFVIIGFFVGKSWREARRG